MLLSLKLISIIKNNVDGRSADVTITLQQTITTDTSRQNKNKTSDKQHTI